MNTNIILSALPKVLKTIDIPQFGRKYQGKVRDFYKLDDKRILITTDRQSAFDVILGHIPFKGTVLNLLSQFWFFKTKHIVPNHLLSVPHPNIAIVKNCQPLPVEMVVRGYISGVTKTSIWYSYQKGERLIYGLKFPEGLKKNQRLVTPIITPTTHPEAGSTIHDERLTRAEIVKRKIVPEKLYRQMENVALQLFDFGSKLCKKRGLILVDTKYEFGIFNGELTLIDEIHTPDSSRFWMAKTYKQRFDKGEEPENYDKEFLRLWYKEKGYLGDGPPPAMSEELIVKTAQRYVSVYEKITGKKFKSYKYPIEEEIKKSLTKSLGVKLNHLPGDLRYKDVGDDYDVKDPFKVFAHKNAKKTSNNAKDANITEIYASRGESAFVFDMGNYFGVTTQEGLGTKNLIADAMYKLTRRKTFYDAIAMDTVATIVNDLITVGARPIVVSPHWAVGNNEWFSDKQKYTDLVNGWVKGCHLAGAIYGGGETPTLNGIVDKNSMELSGSCFGIIKPKKRLLLGDKLEIGDHIVLIQSSGIHTNGLSLARKISEKLPNGYLTKLSNGTTFGEVLLTPSFIYVKLTESLFAENVDLHYILHITGHGWRKIMRANQTLTYRMHTLPFVPEEFTLMQKTGPIQIDEMYGTFNMGAGFAYFVKEKDVKKVWQIAKDMGFDAIDAGIVEKGPRQVIIEPLGITFGQETLQVR